MTTKHILSLAALCALSATAHASTDSAAANPAVRLELSSSFGTEAQNMYSPLGLIFGAIDQKHASLGVGRLHVGASVLQGWLEPGIDLEAGQGTDIASSGAYVSLRVHAFPSLRVHPLLVAGVGLMSEHGTKSGDDQTGYRNSYFAGPGLEVRIDSHWTIALEVRLLTIHEEQFAYMDSSVAYYAAHAGILDLSARLGATYRF
jgi:hypothetical protein